MLLVTLYAINNIFKGKEKQNVSNNIRTQEAEEKTKQRDVEKELEENFDFLIGYNFSRRLISYYSYNDIMISDILYISEALT